MMYATRLTLFFSVLFLAACNGGGGSSSSSDAPAGAVVNSTPQILTGVFNDSPVFGLHFETATQSGLTNDAGQFTYQAGETISFSLGGILLGSSQAAGEVTPLDLLGVTSLDEAKQSGINDQLTNLIIFLQSLDRDQNPNNGIDLGDLDRDLAQEQLAFDNKQFQQDYRRIVNQHAGFYQSEKAALDHLRQSLSLSVTVERIQKETLDTNGDSIIDQTTLYEYTAQGNLSQIQILNSITNDVLATTTYEYDENGNLSSSASGIYEQLFEFHPAFGLLRQSARLDGELISQLENEYDSIGNLVRAESRAEGNVFVISRVAGPALIFSPFFPTPSIPPPTGRTGILRVPNLSAIIGLSNETSTITTVINNQYDNLGNLIQTRTTRSSDSNTQTNTTDYIYEDNRPTRITHTSDTNLSVTEFILAYNADGVQESCERRVDGIVQESVTSSFLTLFPTLTFSASAASSVVLPTSIPLTPCSNLVEYDTAGRVIRIELPDIYVNEFIYENDQLVENTFTTETGQSKTAYSYSSSGQLLEITIFSNEILVFQRTLEYITLILGNP